MKKLMEQLGAETFLGGLFGIIAILAVFVEMALAGFDAASVAGGVKDIAGTVVTVIMLAVAIRALKPKKKSDGGFEAAFEAEMEKVAAKYEPLIQKDSAGAGQWRYNIADDMSVLYRRIECRYHTLFDFDAAKGELTFTVSKTLFMGRSKEDFQALQDSIVNAIASTVTGTYGSILNERHKPTPNGFTLTFREPLVSAQDAVNAAQVIDKVILLYIVQYKKK